LRHRNPAGELGEVFTEHDFKDQRLYLAEQAGLVEPHRPDPQLAKRRDVARHPGE
jgi:hypothetical protein